MQLRHSNVCAFTAFSAGLGDFDVQVSAPVIGFKNPSDAGCEHGRVYSYRAEASNGAEWENGVGSYNFSGQLSRTTIIASSNNHEKVNFTVAPVVKLTTDALNLNLPDPNYEMQEYVAKTQWENAGATALPGSETGWTAGCIGYYNWPVVPTVVAIKTGKAAVSTDYGASWELNAVTDGLVPGGDHWACIAWDEWNSSFQIMSDSTGNCLGASSADGRSWTVVDYTASGDQFSDIVNMPDGVNNTFVIVSRNGTAGKQIFLMYGVGNTLTSPTVGPTGTNQWEAVAYSKERRLLLAVGKDPSTGFPMFTVSKDQGDTWSAPAAIAGSASYEAIDVCWAPKYYGYGAFVVLLKDVTAPGSAAIAISADGENFPGISGYSVNDLDPTKFPTAITYSLELDMLVVTMSGSTTGKVNILALWDNNLNYGQYWTAATTRGYCSFTDVIWMREVGRFLAISSDADGNAGFAQSASMLNYPQIAKKNFGFEPLAIPPANKVLQRYIQGSTFLDSTEANTNSWDGVCWSPELGIFCAVAGADNGAGGMGHRVMTSPDGITWTQQVSTDRAWTSVTWAKGLGLFIAVAYSGSPTGQVMTSPDGITWTAHNAPPDSFGSINGCYWNHVAWYDELGMAIAVGSLPAVSSNNTQVMRSFDGVNWELINNDNATAGLQATAYSPELNRVVAVANVGTNRVFVAEADGWSHSGMSFFSPIVAVTTPTFRTVAWSPEQHKFMAIDYSSRDAYYSYDGLNWHVYSNATPAPGTSNYEWAKLIWVAEIGLWVMVSDISATGIVQCIATSPTGEVWTLATAPSNNSWWDICWSPELGILCAVSTYPGDVPTAKKVMTSKSIHAITYRS